MTCGGVWGVMLKEGARARVWGGRSRGGLTTAAAPRKAHSTNSPPTHTRTPPPAPPNSYVTTAVEVDPSRPVLVDKYLDRAVELDVDALRDATGAVVICGVMEHIEQAGVHSGDSACSLPTQTIAGDVLDQIRAWTVEVATALRVEGLINIQYAVQDDVPNIIEANPRASRTVPFVAKAVGHPIAKYASLVMSGKTLEQLGFTEEPKPAHVAVKEVVLPFNKFPGADTLLGPEMRSTGEVMGIDVDFAAAYAKAQIAAGQKLPAKGVCCVCVGGGGVVCCGGCGGCGGGWGALLF